VRFPQLTVAPVSGKAGQVIEQLKDLLDSSIPIQPVVARWDEANLTSAND
jgi:hypothetical protein